MEQEYFLEMSQESDLNDALAIFLAESVDEQEKQQREAVNYVKNRSPIDFVVEEGSSKVESAQQKVFPVNLPSLGKRTHAAANNIAIYNSQVDHYKSGEYIVDFLLLKCRYITILQPDGRSLFVTERM